MHLVLMNNIFSFPNHVLWYILGGKEPCRGAKIQVQFPIYTSSWLFDSIAFSSRNDKALEGIPAHAHFTHGLLHLILIQECFNVRMIDYLKVQG